MDAETGHCWTAAGVFGVFKNLAPLARVHRFNGLSGVEIRCKCVPSGKVPYRRVSPVALLGLDGPRRHQLCQTAVVCNDNQEEPSGDDYQDRVGYIQACLSRARRRWVSRTDSPWLLQLLARKPEKVAAVALANKMGRIVWAMLVSGELYRQPQAV